MITDCQALAVLRQGRSLQFLIAGAAILFVPSNAIAWTQFQGDGGHTGFVSTSAVPQQNVPTWTVTTIRFLDPTPATRFAPGIASDGQNVFVSWFGNPGTVNGVNALKIESGVEAWEWTFAGNDYEDISAPTYDSGKVYVHRWGHSSSCGITCNDKPRLFGIDAGNGHQIFDQTHSGQWSSGSRPAADAGQVFVAGGYYGGLDNYDGNTGNIHWFAPMPQEYGWIPAVNTDKVYTSFSGNLTVVDKSTGAQQTLLAPSGGGYGSSTPTAAGPHEAYVPYGSVITQFDPANKYATWDYHNASGGVMNMGIAIGDDALYVNFGTTLKALSRQTGTFLWQWNAPTTLTSNVILTKNHLYVGDNSQTFAVDLSSHATDWSAPYGGSLAVVKDFLFVSTQNAIYAFSMAVPEPSTISLLASLAISGVIITRRAKKNLKTRTKDQPVQFA